ncbi:MAG: hypothetical protein QW587_06920 [Candidatus Bathyarchaeia archaeon]
MYGNAGQLIVQAILVVATWLYAFTVSFLLLKLLDRALGLRVEPKEEAVGLDVAQHGEEAYAEVVA